MSTQPGQLSDGTASRYFQVIRQDIVGQRVPDNNGTMRPVATRRTIRIASFRPSGGPNWWPSIRFIIAPYGNDGCQFLDDNVLVPHTDPERLIQDASQLEIALSAKQVAQLVARALTDRQRTRALASIRDQCQRD